MSNQRLAIAKKIEEFEAKGYFDIDVYITNSIPMVLLQKPNRPILTV